MNKLLGIASLCVLVLAPGCRNLYWSKPDNKKIIEVKITKNKQSKSKKEKKRVSGPKGWNVDMSKE